MASVVIAPPKTKWFVQVLGAIGYGLIILFLAVIAVVCMIVPFQ
jgi:hypothetical protein